MRLSPVIISILLCLSLLSCSSATGIKSTTADTKEEKRKSNLTQTGDHTCNMTCPMCHEINGSYIVLVDKEELRKKARKETLSLYEKIEDPNIICASIAGDLDRVRELIGGGEDVNYKDSSGVNALLGAARCGLDEVVKLLIHTGADVNISSKSGRTPLISAASYNNIEVTKILLAAGADVNKSDKAGRTPLMYAVEKDNYEIVKMLVDAGADVNAKISEGKYKDLTALILAEEKGNKKVVELLNEASLTHDKKSE